MTYIVSIDSSTNVCSAALHKSGILLAHTETFLERSHSRNMIHMMETVLALCEVSGSQIDALAVSAGPGSYTGMRIGLSTAKGYCFALDKPLLSVSALYTMAVQMHKNNPDIPYYIPMIDARRMEVYCAIYDHQLEQVGAEQAHILTEQSFSEQLTGNKVLFGGNGSDKYKGAGMSSNALFALSVYPSATCMGEKAFEKYQNGQFEDLAYFEPNYLKEFYTK